MGQEEGRFPKPTLTKEERKGAPNEGGTLEEKGFVSFQDWSGPGDGRNGPPLVADGVE